mgnify:CR=1 FL=1
MSEDVVILMIGVSTLLGAIGLFGLIWAVKTGQFDDESKFVDATRFDNEEDLQAAIELEEKRKERQADIEARKDYRPPD